MFFSQNYHFTASDVNQPFRADSWEGYSDNEEEEGNNEDENRKDYYYYTNMEDEEQQEG